jgi:hypothetical protein
VVGCDDLHVLRSMTNCYSKVVCSPRHRVLALVGVRSSDVYAVDLDALASHSVLIDNEVNVHWDTQKGRLLLVALGELICRLVEEAFRPGPHAGSCNLVVIGLWWHSRGSGRVLIWCGLSGHDLS